VAPDLAELLSLDDAAFRAKFSGSPIKRIGRNRLVRNCLIAAGNSGERGLAGQIGNLTGDPDPMVAEAATWALGKILPVLPAGPNGEVADAAGG
jgi:epoxyqueuosine reductase